VGDPLGNLVRRLHSYFTSLATPHPVAAFRTFSDNATSRGDVPTALRDVRNLRSVFEPTGRRPDRFGGVAHRSRLVDSDDHSVSVSYAHLGYVTHSHGPERDRYGFRQILGRDECAKVAESGPTRPPAERIIAGSNPALGSPGRTIVSAERRHRI
jgi:hypothetical protein